MHKAIRTTILAIIALAGLAVAAAFIYPLVEPKVIVNANVLFKNAVAIPPLLSAARADGKALFDGMTAQIGESRFLVGGRTESFGFNAAYLGPTIRVRKGETVRITLANKLNEATTLHVHGAILPAAMSGGAHQIVAPGQIWTAEFPITQPAATLWYHPETMGKAGEQLYRGLAGLFIIDDDNSDIPGLPNEYGVDDIPLIVQDRDIDGRGQFLYVRPTATRAVGMLGKTILVNGTYGPFLEVPRKLIRLRIVNASNARRFDFAFDDGRSFQQIATDGGLLATPVTRSVMRLAPGERGEIVVDMTAPERVILMSQPIADDENPFVNLAEVFLRDTHDENQGFKILELRPIFNTRVDTTPAPTNLVKFEPLNQAAASRTRRLVLDDSGTINGTKLDRQRADAAVKKGDVEIWEIANRSGRNQSFYVQGVQFQILARDGRPPEPHERGWKDTASLAAGEDVRLIMRFTAPADATLPFMFQSFVLEHRDAGMIGQFVVLDDPAQQPRIKSPLTDSR
ncbi:MAG: copper oxidase [Rhodospirillaceae bacterium]|nr:copper oxidase [Rhodospirillaceae bacterium]